MTNLKTSLEQTVADLHDLRERAAKEGETGAAEQIDAAMKRLGAAYGELSFRRVTPFTRPVIVDVQHPENAA